MADKRSASRQRRTNQNRAARQSLASRRAAAGVNVEREQEEAFEALERDHPVEPDEVLDGEESLGTKPRPPRSSRGRTTPKSSAGRAGPAPRARRGRPTGPSPVPEHDPGFAGYLAGLREVPGGTAVLMGAVLSVAFVAAITFVLKAPVDVFKAIASDAANTKPPPTQSGFQSGGPIAVLFASLPAIANVGALFYALKPQRRRVWFLCAVVAVASSFLYGLLGLFGCGLLAWGAYQTSKAERT